VGRAIRRACLLVAAGSVAACWLTSSFNGLLATGNGMTEDASEPGDAGLDGRIVLLDGSPDASAGDTGSADAPVPSDSATTTDAPADTLAPGDAGCMTDAYVTSVKADQPLGYYRLDEPTGATMAADMSGYNNVGTYQNVVRVSPGALKNDPDTAAGFNGSTSLVTIGGTPFKFTGLSPFSVEAWINPTQIDGEFRGILSSESATNSPRYGYLLYIESPADASTSVISGFERWTGTKSTPAPYTGTITTGAWFHVVGTFDPTMLEPMLYYVNGSQVGQNGATPEDLTPAETFVIGALYGGATTYPSTFKGSIDEVAVYGHALDPTCVRQHYHLGSGL
jgi:hypothetical protein